MIGMELAEIKVLTDGLVVLHNMPCAVCGDKYAVYQSNYGIFLPCWKCQEKGYMLINTKKNWFFKLLRFFNIITKY
ncbi:MAG: hypothetical protein DRN81_01180 [Thermoproteota archaeon]|nr:MAG: hypothetical protein DRN81_01180 [Candidatus Korarchaeota archaeon]